ncbi:MAG: tetratricopeptide repeat protein, partial [Deltaproteobacteria bacterium]|nr:tetratricopeptide repeat protein [Deltaproteobacteria bacterium]
MRPLVAALVLVVFAGCTRAAPQSPSDAAERQGSAFAEPLPALETEPEQAKRLGQQGSDERSSPPLLPLCDPGEGGYLESARLSYDAMRYLDALACSSQAAGAAPDDVDAHAERAWALVSLGRLEDARTAFARALAIAPDHSDALQGAADLYINVLSYSREFAELGLAYAERGRAAARQLRDAARAARFAVLAATALNDLGRSQEAVRRAEEAIA